MSNIVNHFIENNVDVVSSKIKTQLNGNKIRNSIYYNLGGNPAGYVFNMPMTFAFNKNGLNSILKINNNYQFEDIMWRDSWVNDGLVVQSVDNSENIIWNIHGTNISTFDFLEK